MSFDLFLGLRSIIMDFSYSSTQQSIVTSIENIMDNFDDNYWLAADRKVSFLTNFIKTLPPMAGLVLLCLKLMGALILALQRQLL